MSIDPKFLKSIDHLPKKGVTKTDEHGNFKSYTFSPWDREVASWIEEDFEKNGQHRLDAFKADPENAEVWLDDRGWMCFWRNPRVQNLDSRYRPFPKGEEKIWIYVSSWEADEGEISNICFYLEEPRDHFIKQEITGRQVRLIVRKMIDQNPDVLANYSMGCHVNPTALAWEQSHVKVDVGKDMWGVVDPLEE